MLIRYYVYTQLYLPSGEDVSVPRLTELVFQPEDTVRAYSFRLIDDDELEEVEDFFVSLSINETQDGLQLGTNTSSTINIEDNEGQCV